MSTVHLNLTSPKSELLISPILAYLLSLSLSLFLLLSSHSSRIYLKVLRVIFVSSFCNIPHLIQQQNLLTQSSKYTRIRPLVPLPRSCHLLASLSPLTLCFLHMEMRGTLGMQTAACGSLAIISWDICFTQDQCWSHPVRPGFCPLSLSPSLLHPIHCGLASQDKIPPRVLCQGHSSLRYL